MQQVLVLNVIIWMLYVMLLVGINLCTLIVVEILTVPTYPLTALCSMRHTCICIHV